MLPVAVLAGAAACGGPEVGPRIPRADTPSADVGPPRAAVPPVAQPESTAAQPIGPASTDLRDVDWTRATLPGDFCNVPELVTYEDGQATATSQTWGDVHLVVLSENIVYGDFDGDNRNEAAVNIYCNNGGGTASGQLAFGYVIVRAIDGTLQVIGTVTPQFEPSDAAHVSLLAGVRYGVGELTIDEAWYRPSDATCCPTGTAKTTWTEQDGRLVPGTPVVAS